MANCKQCGKAFEAKRSTALYCSSKCRKLAFQSLSVLSVPAGKSLSVPETVNTRRGVDIKCFADLPPDVQADIERYSRACKVDGIEYSREQNREARITRAIKYQHLFPNRFHQQGNSYTEKLPLPPGQFNRVSKPGDPDYDGPQGEGLCKRCGKPTQSPLVSCCYECTIGLPLAGRQAEVVGAEV